MMVDTKTIRERAEKATPPPWHLSKNGERITQTKHITRDVWVIPRSDEDMQFIAAARSDVPALCDALDESRAEVERLRLALRVAIAFQRPTGDGAAKVLERARVETSVDLVGFLRAALAEPGAKEGG